MSNKIELKEKDGIFQHDPQMNKTLATLRTLGYSNAEINATIQVALALTEEEVKQVLDHPKASLFEKTIVKGLIKGLEKGSLFNLDLLLSRAYGKPRESLEIKEEVQRKPFSWRIAIDEQPQLGEGE